MRPIIADLGCEFAAGMVLGRWPDGMDDASRTNIQSGFMATEGTREISGVFVEGQGLKYST